MCHFPKSSRAVPVAAGAQAPGVGLAGHDSQSPLLQELEAEQARHAAWQQAQVLPASLHRANAAVQQPNGCRRPFGSWHELVLRPIRLHCPSEFAATLSATASGFDQSTLRGRYSSPSVTAQWAEQQQAPAGSGASGWAARWHSGVGRRAVAAAAAAAAGVSWTCLQRHRRRFEARDTSCL